MTQVAFYSTVVVASGERREMWKESCMQCRQQRRSFKRVVVCVPDGSLRIVGATYKFVLGEPYALPRAVPPAVGAGAS